MSLFETVEEINARILARRAAKQAARLAAATGLPAASEPLVGGEVVTEEPVTEPQPVAEAPVAAKTKPKGKKK